MAEIQNLAKYLNHSFTAELICICLHILCAIMLISFMISNRNKSPTVQNSPLLTVAAQVALLTASMCLFFGKVVVVRWAGEEDHKWKISAGECYQEEDGLLIALNVIYTLSIELMYMAYFLKIIRIIYIAGGAALLKIFKSELALIGIAGIWGAFIAAIDLYMKFSFHDRNQHQGFKLYPQFNQFLCDSRMIENNAASTIYMVKLFISLSLFMFSWCSSYALGEIDKSLQLKSQSFILLTISFSVIFTDKIIKYFDFNFNTSLPVFYVDCLGNLLAGILLLSIHFNVENRPQYLPDAGCLSKGEDEIYYLIAKPQSLKAIQGFFKKKGQQQTFILTQKITNKNFNHYEPSQQIIQEMKKCLNRQIIENDRELAYEKLKGQLFNKVERILDQWKQTTSYFYLKQKWKKNQIYYERMEQLNLVPKEQNYNSYKSF